MNNEEIRKRIFELSDDKYKEFNSGLCPGTTNIIGVRVPILRNFAKEIAMSNWKAYLENASNEYYEEVMLQGMVIGLAKMDIKEFCNQLKSYIPKIDNWAICDVTVAGLKLTKKYPDVMWNFIQKYLNSNKEFEIRFAIVMLLDFYVTDKYIDKILEIANNTKNEGYYVKMAIAWLISVAFIKFPIQTMKLLKNNKLDDFTYNKALQKIIESYRVDENTKQKIRKMKR